jgi:hydrogenase nickel incorporation protein HypA/HybF
MSIVESVKDSLKGYKVKEVKEIEIEMGELHYVTPEQMQTVFEMASKDTIAEGARLKVTLKKGKIRCLRCGYLGEVDVHLEHEHEHTHMAPHCPKCNDTAVEILEGNDIVIKNIKAEVE